MSILTSDTTQYRFTPDQMKKLIAADLNVDEHDVTVRFVVQDTADDRFGGGPSYGMTHVEVTVKSKP